MLYSLPGIDLIYLLRVLFNRIRRDCHDRLSKLVPVQGDIGLPDLGLSKTDLDRMLAETSMVFHLAATVRFNAPLKEAVELNVEGTARVNSLCHRMPKLEVMITSLFNSHTISPGRRTK
ncbi:hypothetical protein PRIPAC_76961 [Pristionchus pacificus]|nr:hypothetical protein PRIPAC_76961 [Pristionchus pacificus]